MSLVMPAETDLHERTLMCWPARRDMWGEHFAAAEADYAEIANTIASFEPVLMVADPAQAEDARNRCGAGVEVVEIPIDDSWVRDTGPIFVTGDGEQSAVDFGFNAWGEKFEPYADDAKLAQRLLKHLGVPFVEAPFILEGGAIAVDGQGVLVTTEQCLLHPSRNPSMSREQ